MKIKWRFNEIWWNFDSWIIFTYEDDENEDQMKIQWNFDSWIIFMYEDDENEDQMKIQWNMMKLWFMDNFHVWRWEWRSNEDSMKYDETLIHVHLFGPNSLSFTHRWVSWKLASPWKFSQWPVETKKNLGSIGRYETRSPWRVEPGWGSRVSAPLGDTGEMLQKSHSQHRLDVYLKNR